MGDVTKEAIRAFLDGSAFHAKGKGGGARSSAIPGGGAALFVGGELVAVHAPDGKVTIAREFADEYKTQAELLGDARSDQREREAAKEVARPKLLELLSTLERHGKSGPSD